MNTRSSESEAPSATGPRLRCFPPPEWPQRPYPLLLPYTHPALFAGRERELAQLRRLLRLPIPILGLQAPSGTGKSSLVLGGLVPALRQEGRPVAVARHPHEPGLVGRLLGDLLEGADAPDLDALSRAIGADGDEVLEKLATPLTRLIVLREHADGLRYVLSHDRMAEAVVRLVEREGRRGKLLVDAELLSLRRFVKLRSALLASGEEQATRMSRGRYRRIAASTEALLWDEEHRRWWAACEKRRRHDLRHAAAWTAVAALVLTLVAATAWSWARRLREIGALYDQVAVGEPEAAMAALDRLINGADVDLDELRRRLRQRERVMDLLHQGLAAVDEERRAAVVLDAVEVALPLVDETPEDPVLVASLLWALDYAPCRAAAHEPRARRLWDRVLEPLRRLVPPPPLPAADDPEWADVPGGTFHMGTDRDDWGELRPELEFWVNLATPKVAWSRSNATDPVSKEAYVRPVMQLEPNQWGLYDIYGSVNEGVSDWFGPYSAEPQVDPRGPTRGEGIIGRSLNYHSPGHPLIHNFGRGPSEPGSTRSSDNGFRVVLPGCRAAGAHPPSSADGKTTRKP